MNKECFLINGKEHYSIKQMFTSFSVFLSSAPCYNTFYKRFRKWAKDESIEPFKYCGQKLYSKARAEQFIQAYDLVVNYSTPSKPFNIEPLNVTI